MVAQYRRRKREEPLTRVLAQYQTNREESLTEVLLSTAFRTFNAVEHAGNQ